MLKIHGWSFGEATIQSGGRIYFLFILVSLRNRALAAESHRPYKVQIVFDVC